MKVILLVLGAIALAQAAAASGDQAYEDVQIEELFEDDVKRQEFFDCMLGVVDPCNGRNELLKAEVAESFATDCAKCTEKQKEAFKKAVEIMQTKYEDQLKAMLAKFEALKEKQNQ